MRHSLKIFLWFVSLALINACALRFHTGYKKSVPFEPKGYDIVADEYQKLWFKTEIEAYGKEASGLLLVKRVQHSDFRVVLMSHMGMKMFDVELKKDSFVVHYLISFLDKPSVRKLLRNDLSLLLQTPQHNQSRYFVHKKDSTQMLAQKNDGRYYYYQYRNRQLTQKESDGTCFKGTTIRYEYGGVGLPVQILIDHAGLDIHWKLSPVKKLDESGNVQP